ncbi:MAG: helix-turn-helix transcriptional regulator [Bacteroidales bacterium]|nr:helix-turn-helix transcriptional regulator [Bacteroidales bacterium]
MEKIGEKLRAYFEEKGITQEELAAQLGVSQPYVNALLNDKKSFGKKQAQKWNELFGLSVNWLLTGLGDMHSDSIVQNNQNGDNIHGHSVTVNKTEKHYLEIIKTQAEQLSKSQEQIDRLLSIIEKMK